MIRTDQTQTDELLRLTSQIVASYLGRHETPSAEIPALIQQVYQALREAPDYQDDDITPEPSVPAIPIAQSITDDYLYSLEDGQPYKSLKRHLRTRYNMTPEQYREKWGLPADYPMVAPAYARKRSRLAKKSGLGKG